MIVVKDAMVLIHLAKIMLIEESCEYFGHVLMPEAVHKEINKGGHQDSLIINSLIQQGKIKVCQVKDKQLLARAKQFNIQGGEAEAVALYWEAKATLLATDDDNVRKKREALQLTIIGTPAIIRELYVSKKINIQKLRDCVQVMRKIGWFSGIVWDKILLEAEKHG